MRLLFVPAAFVAAVVAACGQAPPGGVATSRRLARPFRPGPNSVVCRPPSRLSSALADGRVEELRQSCIDGESSSCSVLAQQDPPVPADAELARKRLRQLCDADRAASSRAPNDSGLAHDRVCSCGQLGLALLYDAQRRFDEQGLELADEACVGGLMDACDVTSLMADLCNVQPALICAELRAQGRGPKTSRADAGPVALPAAFARCFVVAAVEPCSSAAPDAPDGWRCPSAPGIGTTLCFEDARISMRRPSTPWDQVKTSWVGLLGAERFWSSEETELRVEGGVMTYGRARLRPAPDSAVREARGLPHVEDVCARSRRCVAAVVQTLRPRKRRPENSEEVEEAPDLGSIAELDRRDTLLGCLADHERARARLAKPPPECE